MIVAGQHMTWPMAFAVWHVAHPAGATALLAQERLSSHKQQLLPVPRFQPEGGREFHRPRPGAAKMQHNRFQSPKTLETYQSNVLCGCHLLPGEPQDIPLPATGGTSVANIWKRYNGGLTSRSNIGTAPGNGRQ
jgi:hypothetical protein